MRKSIDLKGNFTFCCHLNKCLILNNFIVCLIPKWHFLSKRSSYRLRGCTLNSSFHYLNVFILNRIGIIQCQDYTEKNITKENAIYLQVASCYNK